VHQHHDGDADQVFAGLALLRRVVVRVQTVPPDAPP
jgi:hypothetical protein